MISAKLTLIYREYSAGLDLQNKAKSRLHKNLIDKNVKFPTGLYFDLNKYSTKDNVYGDLTPFLA